jgi:hypothetical protein
MSSKANPRNHRNNPYALDMFAAQVHHSAAGSLFRFRTELFILLMGAGAFLALARTASLIWALVILAGLVLALFALPWTRRFTVRRAWCVIRPVARLRTPVHRPVDGRRDRHPEMAAAHDR